MRSVLGSDIRNKGVKKNRLNRWMRRKGISWYSIVAIFACVAVAVLISVVESKADYIDKDSSSQTETTTNSDGSSETCVTNCVVGNGCYTTCF